MLKTSGSIANQTFSILIDPDATKGFIYGVALKRIKVKAFEHDAFSYVEIASGAKQKVGGKVMVPSINLGYFFTKANLYVMTL
jgi:hypothetical protein